MNESVVKHSAASRSLPVKERLAYLPINSFAIIMGLSGLAIGWQKITPFNDWLSSVAYLLGSLTSLLFFLLLVAYGTKCLIYSEQVKHELQHPLHLNFFPAVSISLLLMSIFWQASLPDLAKLLWGVGAALQLALTLYVLNQWLFKGSIDLNNVNPTWFIPIVGNIIVPLSGAPFGYAEISWFFFAIGVYFWIVLSAIIFFRLFFQNVLLPDRLRPTLFILLAPPSVGFLAYTSLTHTLDGTARLFYYTALFLGLLLASNVLRFIKLPFYLSCWAYSFPVAALTIASMRLAVLGDLPWCWWLACLLLALLSVLIVWLLASTVKAFIDNKICVPE